MEADRKVFVAHGMTLCPIPGRGVVVVPLTLEEHSLDEVLLLSEVSETMILTRMPCKVLAWL